MNGVYGRRIGSRRQNKGETVGVGREVRAKVSLLPHCPSMCFIFARRHEVIEGD